MAKESLLKKEFTSKDVNRARNLVKKDFSAKTVDGVGYSKAQVAYKEGDVWEESGRNWTIKDGIRQNITKLDSAKKALQIPLACPKCKGTMNYYLSKKMYKIHKMCFDCVIDYETKLKVRGEYKEYEQNMIRQGVAYHIKEMENVLLELLMAQSGESYVTEAGDIEEWKGKSLDNQFIKDIQEYIQKLKDAMNA